MVELALRRSPLAHLGLKARAVADAGAAGVRMSEAPRRVLLELRGDPGNEDFMAAVEDATGLAPPTASPDSASKGERGALWLGPDRWLIVAPGEDDGLADTLRQALADIHHAVTEISDSFAAIRLAGPTARDVLAKGCTLDLHPRAFAPGHVAQSTLAKAQVILHQPKDGVFEIFTRRSFAEYLWAWLEDAGLEYGVAVVDG